MKPGWLTAPIEQGLRCPHGHRIRDGWLVTASQCVRCNHRDDRTAPPCGALLWVITTHAGAVFVASVSHADVVTIKGHASVQDTLRYLGAPMWGEAA
jgi:hypothetical protein